MKAQIDLSRIRNVLKDKELMGFDTAQSLEIPGVGFSSEIASGHGATRTGGKKLGGSKVGTTKLGRVKAGG